ncbi:MAG: hypothetical protein HMLKMBBP_03798 [Planctomycetes bacterium]|nr:hypothetical protein [Planctomycetota bacterium]
MTNCPKCNAVADDSGAFCPSCGSSLTGAAAPAPGRRRLGNLAVVQHEKHTKSARSSILIVAILLAAGGVLMWFLVKKDADEVARIIGDQDVASNPHFREAKRLVARAWLLVASNFVLAAGFVGLWIWAKRNAFGATLTAFIAFLTLVLVNAVVDPATIVQGVIVKILVIAALLKGLKSGLALRKLEQGDRTGAA